MTLKSSPLWSFCKIYSSIFSLSVRCKDETPTFSLPQRLSIHHDNTQSSVCVCVCDSAIFSVPLLWAERVTIAPPLQALTSFSIFTRAAPFLASLFLFLLHILIMCVCLSVCVCLPPHSTLLPWGIMRHKWDIFTHANVYIFGTLCLLPSVTPGVLWKSVDYLPNKCFTSWIRE